MSKFLRHTAVVALAIAIATPALAREEQPLKLSSAQNVKGIQSVVIGAFTVGFIFESIDKTKATGGMIGAFGGATRAKSVLAGVTPETMQAITDAAFADFRAQLAAQGFTVSDSAAMFASADFKKVKTVASPYDAKVQLDKKSTGKATYYAPTNMPGILLLPGDITASGMSGIGMNMAAGQNGYYVSTYSKAAGQAVVDVIYLIDFSDLKRPGAFSFGGLEVNSGMSVVDDYSKLSIVTAAGKTAAITVNAPVAVEGDFAAKADTTKGGGFQKAANITSGVLGGLSILGGGRGGGMMFGKDKTFTFTAKPAYRDGAIKAASLANTRIVTQLTALR